MPDEKSPLQRIEELGRTVESLKKELDRLTEENARLRKENEIYRQKVDRFVRHHYGSRSESISEDQLELLLQGLERSAGAAPPVPPVEPKRRRSQRRSHRPRFALNDQNLPTREEVLEPAEVLKDPEGWTRVSEERTSQLDWVPPQIIKRVIVRPRYVRKERFAIAALPPQPIDKGMVGPGLLAHILINKFEYHQPLYRQEKIFRQQHQVELSRKTMGYWVEQCAELLKPVYLEIGRGLLAGDYLQADETTFRYLDPDIRGKSGRGWLWAYGRPGADVFFQWQTSRGKEAPAEFLKDFRGKLQTDGYGVYESICRDREELDLVGCWAHARRMVHEAATNGSRQAAWLIGQIGSLYHIESQLRKSRAGPALRQAVRAGQSRMILSRVFKAMERLRIGLLPQHLLRKAIDYALSRREQLSKFIADGRLEIDNNLIYAERGINQVMPPPDLCRVVTKGGFLQLKLSDPVIAGAA